MTCDFHYITRDLELLPLQNNVNVYGYGPYLQGIRTDLGELRAEAVLLIVKKM